MSDDIQDLVQDYLAECYEHLADIETDLLAIEAAGAVIDEKLVNRVFRAAHSIKGGAGLLDLVKIQRLAHQAENTLDSVRSLRLVPTPDVVSVLLRAFDTLRDLLGDYQESDRADITLVVAALAALTQDHRPAQVLPAAPAVGVCSDVRRRRPNRSVEGESQ